MAAIILADDSDRLDQIRRLFREYEAWLEISLCFQDFEQELANLPGKYAPPKGRLYLLEADQQFVGCAALRPLDEITAEVKRLYVNPNYRNRSFGKMLMNKLIAEAGFIGYHRLVLDTLPKMSAAIQLYRSLGFRDTLPYYDNPVEGVVYMELAL